MFKFPPDRRPIIVIGNTVYRAPRLRIQTTPKIDLASFIVGEFDHETTKIEYFINDIPVRITNGRQVPRRSGRFVYCFDHHSG